MKELTIEITIGEHKFYNAADIQIERSWSFLSDTATVVLSRLLFPKGSVKNASGEVTNNKIKVGDPISIRLGYDYVFQTEFEGYIKVIKPNSPVTLECEDAMWLLKQTNYTQSWRKVSLSQLLDFIIPKSMTYETFGEVNLGKMRLDKVSAYDVLKKIDETYKLVSYFKENKLYVGFPYQQEAKRTRVEMQRHVDDEKTTLSYRTADQVKLKFKAISIQKDGSKIEVELGDEDGQLRTMHLPIGLSKAEIKRVAEEQKKLFTFDGYDGSIVTFGQPVIHHSDVVEIVNWDYPDRTGAYRVDTVQVSCGAEGYRRTLTLGNKVE